MRRGVRRAGLPPRPCSQAGVRGAYLFQALIRSSLMSSTTTSMLGHLAAIMACGGRVDQVQSGPRPHPAGVQGKSWDPWQPATLLTNARGAPRRPAAGSPSSDKGADKGGPCAQLPPRHHAHHGGPAGSKHRRIRGRGGHRGPADPHNHPVGGRWAPWKPQIMHSPAHIACADAGNLVFEAHGAVLGTATNRSVHGRGDWVMWVASNNTLNCTRELRGPPAGQGRGGACRAASSPARIAGPVGQARPASPPPGSATLRHLATSSGTAQTITHTHMPGAGLPAPSPCAQPLRPAPA
jgi:hypothetical protein